MTYNNRAQILVIHNGQQGRKELVQSLAPILDNNGLYDWSEASWDKFADETGREVAWGREVMISDRVKHIINWTNSKVLHPALELAGVDRKTINKVRGFVVMQYCPIDSQGIEYYNLWAGKLLTKIEG